MADTDVDATRMPPKTTTWTTAPSPETQERITLLITKLIRDAGYVAPEMQNEWWASRLAKFAGLVWRLAHEAKDEAIREDDVKHDRPTDRYFEHADRELRLAGFFMKDADYYDPKVGASRLVPHVLALLSVFSAEHHSGASAALTVALFKKLALFEPLSPLTNDPSEWVNVSAETGQRLWQNNRNSEAFSTDGGKTYYLMNETCSRHRCDKCGVRYTTKPVKNTGHSEVCSCGGFIRVEQYGLERDDPRALHTAVDRTPA